MPRSPGWHTDPSDNTKWRYWDGADWTEQSRPKTSGGVAAGPPPPIPPTPAAPPTGTPESTRSAGIGRFFGRKTDAEKTALAKYQALLDAVVAGSADLRQLPEQLRSTADAAGLRGRKASKLQDQAFRALAQRTLNDDILTVAEEHELLEVADALGIGEADLESRFLDIVQHLMIARVNDGRLPVLDQHLLMEKPGEVVHMETSAALLEEVVHREYRGGGGGISVPIGLGARFSTGGFRGKPVVVGTSLEPADTGTLSVTDRRVVFQGQKKTLECCYDKMVGMEAFSDGLRIGVSNRQTAALFRIAAGPVVAATITGAMQKQYPGSKQDQPRHGGSQEEEQRRFDAVPPGMEDSTAFLGWQRHRERLAARLAETSEPLERHRDLILITNVMRAQFNIVTERMGEVSTTMKAISDRDDPRLAEIGPFIDSVQPWGDSHQAEFNEYAEERDALADALTEDQQRKAEREVEKEFEAIKEDIKASLEGEKEALTEAIETAASGRQATKVCPDCAEEVKAAARKCRHCGYRFDADTADAEQVESRYEAIKQILEPEIRKVFENGGHPLESLEFPTKIPDAVMAWPNNQPGESFEVDARTTDGRKGRAICTFGEAERARIEAVLDD